MYECNLTHMVGLRHKYFQTFKRQQEKFILY